MLLCAFVDKRSLLDASEDSAWLYTEFSDYKYAKNASIIK
jgi:hypothetical protein